MNTPIKHIVVCCGLLLSYGFSNAQDIKTAKRLTENEQFETAARQFRQILLAQPANGEAYYFFGENYFKSGDQDSAYFMYKTGAEKMPNLPLNHIGLARVELNRKNKSAADAHMATATKLMDPKSAAVRIEMAEALIKSEIKDLEKAMTLLNEAAKLEPKNPEIYIQMGDIYAEKNDGNAAITQYNKAKDLDKTSVKAILRQGQLYGRAKNYMLALEKYQEAAKIDSTFAPAYREQGEIYYMAKKYEAAKQKYRRYLDLSGNLTSARIRYASFLFLNKNYEEAISEFSQIEKLDTTKNYLNRLMAYSLFEKGDYPSGMKYINKFFTRAVPEKTIILASDYEYRGKLYAKTGKDSLAIEDLLTALNTDSSKVELYSDLASSSAKLKRHAEAIKYYQKKVQLKQATTNDWFAMGRAYYQSKDFSNADSAFKKVTELQPNLPLGYLWRAKASTQLDPESSVWLAKPHYEAFLMKVTDPAKSTKDLVEAYSYLGYYHYKQKEKDKAKEAWLKVAELDPGNEKAKKVLEELK
jgi:tetratricopeptide (TPR) repeat protein